MMRLLLLLHIRWVGRLPQCVGYDLVDRRIDDFGIRTIRNILENVGYAVKPPFVNCGLVVPRKHPIRHCMLVVFEGGP